MKTNHILLVIGLSITLGFVAFIGIWRWDDVLCAGRLPLNELGDFFAGVFGPLALFWVILGFIQQGIELRQNSDALNLQAKELANSTEQQRLLVESSNKEVQELIKQFKREEERRRESEQPDFKLIKAIGSSGGGGKKEFHFEFVNKGPIASELRISMNPEREILEKNEWKKTSVDTNQHFTLRWESRVDEIPNCITIEIRCLDSKGILYCRVFELLTTDKSRYNLTQDYEEITSQLE